MRRLGSSSFSNDLQTSPTLTSISYDLDTSCSFTDLPPRPPQWVSYPRHRSYYRSLLQPRHLLQRSARSRKPITASANSAITSIETAIVSVTPFAITATILRHSSFTVICPRRARGHEDCYEESVNWVYSYPTSPTGTLSLSSSLDGYSIETCANDQSEISACFATANACPPNQAMLGYPAATTANPTRDPNASAPFSYAELRSNRELR